jgi:hypothetical protein
MLPTSVRLAQDVAVISEIPNSSRAWGSRHHSRSAAAPPAALGLIDATLDVDFGKLIELILGILAQLPALARKFRLLSVGLRADDTYSPAAIDMAPAASPAAPAIKILCCVAAAAATPTIKLAVERIPSLTPSTAALGHPIRSTRW